MLSLSPSSYGIMLRKDDPASEGGDAATTALTAAARLKKILRQVVHAEDPAQELNSTFRSAPS
jgi:hypothetical protein